MPKTNAVRDLEPNISARLQGIFQCGLSNAHVMGMAF